MPTQTIDNGTTVVDIPLNEIKSECGNNVRSSYDEAYIAELAESIAQHGLLQPIIVVGGPELAKRGGDGSYGVVIGRNRYRALLKLKSEKRIKASEPIRCVVDNDLVDATGEISGTGVARMLIENLQRQDISVLDEAKGYARLIEDNGYTQRDVAATLGRSPGHVAKRLALLTLPAEVIAAIGTKVTLEQAYELSQLDEDQIKKITKNIAGGGQATSLSYDILNAKTTQAKRRKSEKFKKALDKMMIEPVKDLPGDVDKELFECLGWFDEDKLKAHTMRKNHIVVAGAAPMTEVYIWRQLTPKQLETKKAKEAQEAEARRREREEIHERQEQEYAEYIETEADPHEQWEYKIDSERERYRDEMSAYNQSIIAQLGNLIRSLASKDLGKMVLALCVQQIMAMRHVQKACTVLGIDVAHEYPDGSPMPGYDRPWRSALLDWIDNDPSKALMAWIAVHTDAEDVRNLDVFAVFRAQLDDQGITPPAPLDLDQFGPEPWYDDATETWRTDYDEQRTLLDGTVEPDPTDFELQEEYEAAKSTFDAAWQAEQVDQAA